MTQVPNLRLNNGVEIPQFGFGVFQVPPDQTAETVQAAFDAGYRHIDTAQMYGNEEGVGQALAASGLARDEVFITTKLNNDGHGYDTALRRLDESLRTRHRPLDLYLIHWPRPAEDRYVDTWRGFEKPAAEGKARSIGVSNFTVAHLERLAARPRRSPRSTRSSCTRRFPQPELRGTTPSTASRPRRGARSGRAGPAGRPTLAELAPKYGKTPAQVVLRWHVQLGNIVFPKSTAERMRENIDVFDFELSGRTSRP